jgi:hypothetical protein
MDRSISSAERKNPGRPIHIQIRIFISRYGIPNPDMESHIQIWKSISGYGIPYPDMEKNQLEWPKR